MSKLRELQNELAELNTVRKHNILNATEETIEAVNEQDAKDAKRVSLLESKIGVLKAAKEAEKALVEKEGTPATEPKKVAVENTKKTEKAPVVLRRHAPLKAFKDPKDALVAGHRLAVAIFGDPKIANRMPANTREVVANSKKWLVENAMSGDVDSAGGFTVDEEWTNAVIDLQEQYGIARQTCRVWPMGTDTLHIPRKSGTPTAEWVSPQGTTITPSDQTWGEVKLVTEKLAALTVYSTELAEDSLINIADNLARDFAIQFALAEDEALFNGTGSPITGLESTIHANATVTTANSWSGVLFTDFEAAIGLTSHLINAQNQAWFMSKPAFYATCARLIDAAGGINKMDIETGKRPMFLGYPVYFCQVLPRTSTATETLGYFGDMSLTAAFGNRRGLTVMQSEHRYFENDQIGIRATERIDIVVHETGQEESRRPMVRMVLGT